MPYLLIENWSEDIQQNWKHLAGFPILLFGTFKSCKYGFESWNIYRKWKIELLLQYCAYH